jgi:hypothetical protein
LANDVRCVRRLFGAKSLSWTHFVVLYSACRSGMLCCRDDAHGCSTVRPGPSRNCVPRQSAPVRRDDRRRNAHQQDGASPSKSLRSDARTSQVLQFRPFRLWLTWQGKDGLYLWAPALMVVAITTTRTLLCGVAIVCIVCSASRAALSAACPHCRHSTRGHLCAWLPAYRGGITVWCPTVAAKDEKI